MTEDEIRKDERKQMQALAPALTWGEKKVVVTHTDKGDNVTTVVESSARQFVNPEPGYLHGFEEGFAEAVLLFKKAIG